MEAAQLGVIVYIICGSHYACKRTKNLPPGQAEAYTFLPQKRTVCPETDSVQKPLSLYYQAITYLARLLKENGHEEKSSEKRGNVQLLQSAPRLMNKRNNINR